MKKYNLIISFIKNLIILTFLIIFLISCNKDQDLIKNIEEKKITNFYKQEISYSAKRQREISETYDYKIFYTDDGYFPNNLNIKIGETVAFINNSSIPMWTASDPHPVHSDYSIFDSKKSKDYNKIYTMTFNDSGTFGFHNHEKSNHRGIIKVVDPKNPKPNIDKTKESQRKTRDKLLSILDFKDPKSIYKLIDKIESDNRLSRDCHDIAHDLGHEAYELFGFSTAMTFSDPDTASHTSVDDICAGGYMHGILEELFLHRPELKNNPEKVCSGVPELHKGSCFHGVGHGVMFANLRDVEKSLSSCRNLSTNTYTYRCFEGVWMELFWGNTDHSGADSLGWDIKNPFKTCENAKKDEKPTCYLYSHLGYLRVNSRDYVGVINFCTGAGVKVEDSKFCLKGIGITMMKHFTSLNLEKTEKLVENMSYDLKYSYYQGVIGYSILSGIKKSALRKFCDVLKNDKQVCLDVLEKAK